MTNNTSKLRSVKGEEDRKPIHVRDITRVISVTSGKGGVGKTTTVVNMAVALARLGQRVLVLDADLGLANVNIMLGLKPDKTIENVIDGNCLIEEIMVDGPDGVSIIPATSGVSRMAALSQEQRLSFMYALENLAYEFDYLIIDTQAGIGPDVLQFNSAASEIVCVINEEPTSLTDTYGLIKVMAQEYGEKRFSILVNNVSSEREAKRAYIRLSNAVEQFLQAELQYLGWVARDEDVSEAVKAQRALLEVYPSSKSARSFASIAKRLDQEFYQARVKGGMQLFFRELLEVGA